MLKGHVKVTLRDAKTGKIDQIVEGDNIVTNAVGDLLGNNVLGCVDYTKIYPLWSRWFKGCLALEQPFTLTADDYFIKDDSVNRVVAHAGDVSPDDIADDLKRGNPNTHTQVVQPNFVRQIWEWGPKQGNGTISSIALTHKDVGNAGVGADSVAFRAFQPFDVISIGLSTFASGLKSSENVIAKLNDHYGLWFEIGEPGEYSNSHSIFETTSITLYFKKLAYGEIGIYETTSAITEFDEKITVDLGVGNHLYCQPSYYLDGNKLHLFSNITGINQYGSCTWNSNVRHFVITIANDLSSATVTDVDTIPTGRSDLAPVCIGHYGQGSARPSFRCIAHQKVGAIDYWFFPVSANDNSDLNAKGYLKCDDSGAVSYFDLLETQNYIKSGMTGTGICPIIMSGRVINGGHGYTCSDQFVVNEPWKVADWAFSTPNDISSYLVPIGGGTSITASRYIVANKMVYTTKFNLPQTIIKTASQAMTVEYTITEV